MSSSLTKVDVNSVDEYGMTPMGYAAARGRESIVRLLLESGRTKVNLKDAHGNSPLALAAREGHEPVVRLLLDRTKSTSMHKIQTGKRQY